MRSGALIAVTISAVIAGVIAILTEPVGSAQGDLPKSPVSISKPAAKGDRLDPRRAGRCMFLSESASAPNTCTFQPAQPEPRPAEGHTAIVDLWQTALPSPLIATNDTAVIGWRII
jgi:hypothetical protein